MEEQQLQIVEGNVMLSFWQLHSLQRYLSHDFRLNLTLLRPFASGHCKCECILGYSTHFEFVVSKLLCQLSCISSVYHVSGAT